MTNRLRRIFASVNEELDREEEYVSKKDFADYLCWYINPAMKKAAKEQEQSTVVNPNFAKQVAAMNAEVKGDIEI